MKRILSTAIAGLLFANIAAANNPPPAIKADAPNRYVVKKGDTLWGISGKYLEAPTRWREIWATNKQIKNPHLIYPNDVLILCIIQGKTLVGVDTGEGCFGVEKQMNSPSAPVSASTPQTFDIPSEQHITTIPLNNIRQWLDRSVIVDPRDFETTPYVLASKTGNLITAEGDKIYARGAPLTVGQRYGIYRKGEPYVDPRTGVLLGLETRQVAAAIVTSVANNGVSSLEIKENYGSEIREGDRVFVEVDAPIPNVFYPAPAQVTRGGLIIRVMGSIGSAAKDSVVAINLGANEGAQPGQVLDVYKKGALVRDIKDNNNAVRLPSELAGQLMIFKSFNNISYAYVLNVEVPLSVGDQLLPPQEF